MTALRDAAGYALHVSATPSRLRQVVAALLLVTPLAVLGATIATQRHRDFVGVDGPHLVLAGRPFRFVGANLAIMHDEPWRSRARDTLAAAAADGLTVGRVWALGEGPADADDWERREHLFRAGPDGWVEAGFVHLDRVLADARQLGLRLIIVLANNWSDYGGVPMYLQWAGIDPESYGARARFYSDPQIRRWYRAHVARLMDRRNTVTGVLYRDDPTILAWELINESTVLTPGGAAARRDWIVEMSRFIHSRDPHHLVAPGLAGYDTRRDRDEWLRIMRLPEVDYCDLHLYPQENVYRLGGRRQIESALDDAAQLARFVVGKPLVVGEFSFRAILSTWEGHERSWWFDTVLERTIADGAAGALAWVYEPWRGRERKYGIYIDDERSAPVRAVLRGHATRLRTEPVEVRNEALGAARGTTPFLDQFVTVTNQRAPVAAWRARPDGTLEQEIAPTDFATARWERLGTWDGGPLVHAYGADVGHFEYRFAAAPGTSPAELLIRARLSAEFPGSWAPAELVSRVEVTIDGHRVATLVVPADDGLGRWHQISVQDRALLRQLSHGEHALRFTVRDGPDARGVAIYGKPTGKGPWSVPDAGPITLRLRGD
jgi:hypothetical protein